MGEFHALPSHFPLNLSNLPINETLVTEWMDKIATNLNPRNYMYERAEDVPNYMHKASWLFEISLIIEILVSVMKGKNVPTIYYGFTNVSAGMMTEITKMMVKPFYYYVCTYLHYHYRLLDLPWDSMLTWWLAFVAVDFSYYWLHRGAHEVNFMWAAHQAHHSSEDYNLSTAMRQGIMQYYTATFAFVPASLFIPPPALFLHHHFNLCYQFFIHTELVDNLGAPLEFILNTPSHHRVHHGRNPYCIDKNYAGIFIVWDRMFGTFAPEDEKEKVAYGLVHVQESSNIYWVQFGHYIDLWKRMMKLDSLSDKLGVWLRGPGWMAEQEMKGLTPEQMQLPEVENPIQSRDLKKHRAIDQVYVYMHGVLVITSIFNALMLSTASFSLSERFAAVAYMHFSMLVLGFMMDKKSYALQFELLRCIGSLVLGHVFDLNHLPVLGKFSSLQPYRVIFAASAILMLGWVARGRNMSTENTEAEEKKAQ